MSTSVTISLLERVVAIKIPHASVVEDALRLERFRREAISLATVRSPHIVGVYDIGLTVDGAYLVMQHIEGRTLMEEMRGFGPMTQTRAATVLTQLLAGLAAMHRQGLASRDIRASNVVLDRNDKVSIARPRGRARQRLANAADGHRHGDASGCHVSRPVRERLHERRLSDRARYVVPVDGSRCLSPISARGSRGPVPAVAGAARRRGSTRARPRPGPAICLCHGPWGCGGDRVDVDPEQAERRRPLR